jgi:hypothetical protein
MRIVASAGANQKIEGVEPMGYKETRECEVCGAPFHIRSRAPGHGRFCSKPCKGVWMRDNNPAKRTHGMTTTPTFKTWDAMKQRCLNPRSKDYADYGGRGISISPRWAQSFEAFLADMGERPAGTTIDREDVHGNYEPGNCRWATSIEQQNNKRSSRTVTAHGRTMTIAEWSRVLGTSRQTIRHRLEAGWAEEAAVSIPPIKGGHHGPSHH